MIAQNSLRLAAFAVLSVSAISFAAPPEGAVAQKLKEIYPKAEAEVVGTNTVNGVTVDDITVTAQGDTVSAQITSYGDILYYGIPRESKKLDARAAETLKGLLKTVPADVDTYRTSYLVIDLVANKQSWQLTFNALGQLLDVSKTSTPKEAPAASVGAGTRKKLEELAVRYSDGGKLLQIAPYSDVDGYYIADLTGKNGLGLHIVMNEAGQVWEIRFDMRRDNLPTPVAAAMEQLFDGSSITRVSRVEEQFYQFDQTAGDQTLKIRMHPNGDIFKISEVPMAEATKAKKKRKA